MDGNKQKHLEFIQGVIDRMARNSFSIRGWAITLLVGILVISAAGDNGVFFRIGSLLAAVAVLVSFLLLDSYFLAQERRYRKFYDEVRKKKEEEIDFEMVPGKKQEENQELLWREAIRSMTVKLFYVPVFIVITIVYGFLVGLSTGLFT